MELLKAFLRIFIICLVLLSVEGDVDDGEKFIAYECGTTKQPVSTYSLVHPGECNFSSQNVTSTKRRIQLYQTKEFTHTDVFECKVIVRRKIFRCDLFSHVSAVKNGDAEYVYNLSNNHCLHIHRAGEMLFNVNTKITGILVNSTKTVHIPMAGSKDNDGNCAGEQYTDSYGTWDDAIVEGEISISIWQYRARVSVNNDEILLRSNRQCKFSNYQCMDMHGGNVFWNPTKTTECNDILLGYTLLYEGEADKLVDKTSNDSYVIYVVNKNNVTFALTVTREQILCNQVVSSTQHPKLIIIDLDDKRSYFHNHPRTSKQPIDSEDIDIFTYLNSKFMYVEYHVQSQLNELYKDVMEHICNIELQILKNSMSLAIVSPDRFAYNLMNGPGYMAVVAGEVIHIVKCLPVEVILRHENQSCYADLPVSKSTSNKTYFATPVTHILMEQSTLLDCNKIVASMYYVNRNWIQVLPNEYNTMTADPNLIQVTTKPTWNFHYVSHWGDSGIYYKKELDAARKQIMFPMERYSLLNEFARFLRGWSMNDDSALKNLINKPFIEKFHKVAWEHFWDTSVLLGSIISAFLFAIFLWNNASTVASVFLRGRLLYYLFGWSIHLIAALFNFTTQLLIHKATKEPKAKEPSAPPMPPSTLPPRPPTPPSTLPPRPPTPPSSLPPRPPPPTLTPITTIPKKVPRKQKMAPPRPPMPPSTLPPRPPSPTLPAITTIPTKLPRKRTTAPPPPTSPSTSIPQQSIVTIPVPDTPSTKAITTATPVPSPFPRRHQRRAPEYVGPIPTTQSSAMSQHMIQLQNLNKKN